MMVYQNNLFSGRVAIVTGATQGIGAAIANELALFGAKVTAVGVGEPTGDLNDGIDVRVVDVSSQGQMASLFETFDDLNILVNCAGIIRRGEEHRVDVFERVLAVNLTGTMRACALARPLLKRSGGVVVNMASMLSFFGGALVPGYAASKGGVAQLTKSLALAYAVDNIRVNAVAPGWIATPLTKALQDNPSRSEPILSRTPLGRWGTPRDVASTVMFLCSDAASFITGIILPVDGGYLAA